MDPALKPADREPDRSLTETAQTGDLRAFDDLARRHYPRVYRVLCRLLGRAEDAEDAAQEVMIAAWENLPRFRGDSAFTTWLHAVTVRRGISAVRGVIRRKTESLDDPHAAEAEDRRDGPERSAERREESERLRHALSRLPEAQRNVAVLYYYGEVSCREIAGELGMAESTVRGHLRRARENLRRLLPEMREGGR